MSTGADSFDMTDGGNQMTIIVFIFSIILVIAGATNLMFIYEARNNKDDMKECGITDYNLDQLYTLSSIVLMFGMIIFVTLMYVSYQWFRSTMHSVWFKCIVSLIVLLCSGLSGSIVNKSKKADCGKQYPILNASQWSNGILFTVGILYLGFVIIKKSLGKKN